MRRNFSLAAVLAVILSTSASAAPERLQYPLDIGTTNPCSGLVVTGSQGEVKIDVTVRKSGEVKVGFLFKSVATDTGGGSYRVTLKGGEAFVSLSPTFDVPWTGEFVGKQGAPTFTFDGTVQIYVDDFGVPYTAFLMPSTPACALP